MHGGKIWVDSVTGQGATFSFYVPIKPPGEDEIVEEEDQQVPDTPPAEDDKRLVIAIDNDPGVTTLYKRFLEKQNYDVLGLKHGPNVLEQIKEYNPYAILLDVISPNNDGWGMIKTLKEDPFTKDVPVIICSIVSDKNRGFSLGATNYLIKPIVEDELIEALKRLDVEHKDEIKVLVVDDQADDILLIRRILEAQTNYSIIEAGNGKEGLKLVKSKEPDLIILDLNMPEMNGFAMVEALKENEKTRRIPIIIVSAQELTPEEHERLTGQVEVMLRKGIFTENELLEDVSHALQRISKEANGAT
jgi:CheY-like chemotaxis protein